MIEGPVLVAEAIAAGLTVELVVVEDPADSPSGPPVHLAEPGSLAKVGDTVSGRAVMAIARIPERGLPDHLSFVVVCDRLADPGNLGTIIRSSEAAGAQAVVLTAGSVDPWNPKVVRAAAGSLFRLPVLTADPASLGLVRIGAVARGGAAPEDLDLTRPVALVIGNEAHGIDPDLALDQLVTIPHAGPAESLNAAMAATVLCFEVARQRRVVFASHPSGVGTIHPTGSG